MHLPKNSCNISIVEFADELLLQPVGTNILVSPEEKLIAQSIYGNT
jgi:hypothetical protein